MFKLRYSDAVEVVWDSLPDDAREELGQAILDVCQDPYARSKEHRGQKHQRILVLQHTVIALLIIDAPPIQRVYIRNIDRIG